jgi:hypothetical protein
LHGLRSSLGPDTANETGLRDDAAVWWVPGRRHFSSRIRSAGFGPRTWQAWAVVGLYAIVVLGLMPMLPLDPSVRHELWGISMGLLIASMLLTYKAD